MDGCDSVKDYILLLSAAMVATTAFMCMDGKRRDQVSARLPFPLAIKLIVGNDLNVSDERRTGLPDVDSAEADARSA